jgi:hypothetical protein
MRARAYVFIGDHSPSNSETWSMTIGDYTHAAPGYGVVQRDLREFKKGESYPVTVQHLGSIYPTGNEDFDYRAWVDRYAAPAWTSGNPVPSGHEFFVTDPQQLFQRQYWSESGNSDPTAGKSATLHFPAIDLDIDSDFNGALERSLAEDVAEADSTQGLYTPVFSGDIDRDGILDSVDFDGIAGASFAPVVVSLSENLLYASPSSVGLTFQFDDAGFLANASGLFRLWTKDASHARGPGDLIAAGTTISATTIGLAPGSSVTLYLEAVNPTRRTVHFDPISVTASVVGDVWTGQLVDKVHARGFNASIDVEIDSDNNQGFDLPAQTQ